MPITNTANSSPFVNLLTALPGGIEAQERRGQHELVNSTNLPTDCSPEDQAKLEAAGVVFGAVVPDDDIFREATLPQGWQLKATEHSMWSELVDQEGAVRASVFYKAAFYDRSAFMRVR